MTTTVMKRTTYAPGNTTKMKITRRQLRRIIQEQNEKMLPAAARRSSPPFQELELAMDEFIGSLVSDGLIIPEYARSVITHLVERLIQDRIVKGELT